MGNVCFCAWGSLRCLNAQWVACSHPSPCQLLGIPTNACAMELRWGDIVVSPQVFNVMITKDFVESSKKEVGCTWCTVYRNPRLVLCRNLSQGQKNTWLGLMDFGCLFNGVSWASHVCLDPPCKNSKAFERDFWMTSHWWDKCAMRHAYAVSRCL